MPSKEISSKGSGRGGKLCCVGTDSYAAAGGSRARDTFDFGANDLVSRGLKFVVDGAENFGTFCCGSDSSAIIGGESAFAANDFPVASVSFDVGIFGTGANGSILGAEGFVSAISRAVGGKIGAFDVITCGL